MIVVEKSELKRHRSVAKNPDTKDVFVVVMFNKKSY